MTSVRTLSGYVTTADGEPLVFAIIANNFETPADVVNGADRRDRRPPGTVPPLERPSEWRRPVCISCGNA